MRVYVPICIYPTLYIISQLVFYSLYILLCISHSFYVPFYVYLICIYFICNLLFVYLTLCVAYFVYPTASCSMCIALPIYFTLYTLNKLVPFDLRSFGDQKFLTLIVSLKSLIAAIIYCNNSLLRQLSTIMDANSQVTYYNAHKWSSTASEIMKEQLLKHLMYIWNWFIIIKGKLRSCVFGIIRSHMINFKLTILIRNLQIQNFFQQTHYLMQHLLLYINFYIASL